MKTLTTAVDNAFAAPNVPFLVLIDLDFASGHVYLCNAPYNFTFAGNVYLGAARCGAIEDLPESSDLSMSGIRLTLTGVDPAYVSLALAEPFQGRPCTVSIAALDSNYQILPDPVVPFKGRLDMMDIDMGETATITVTVESRLTDWNRPAIRRYNHEDQTALFPTDKFFEYIPQMVEKPLLWGVPSPAVPAVPEIFSSGGAEESTNISNENSGGG